jgi:pyruvate dehydrogenase E2 component (dihydrolipoamide acetyltransferase)
MIAQQMQESQLLASPHRGVEPLATAAVVDEGVAVSSEAPAGRSRRGVRERTFTDKPLTAMRKVIAHRLTDSKANIPHFYSRIDCKIDAMVEYRKVLMEAGIKVSLNDMVIRAAALALRDVPAANKYWDEGVGNSVGNPTVDISVAVATEGGLITPIVKDADVIGLRQINASVAELAGRAREGKLAPDEYTGGSFTISNLGMFGIKEFSAVINPPQACILAVGGGVGKPSVGTGNGGATVVKKTEMTVNLSSDRRVVNEQVAAEYLAAFQRYAETPQLLATV